MNKSRFCSYRINRTDRFFNWLDFLFHDFYLPGVFMNFPHSPFYFVLSFMRQQWKKFSVIASISICWALNDAIFPYFLKRIIDTLQNYPGETINVYSAVSGTLITLVLFWIFSEILMRVQGITQIYTFPYFRANIRAAVFEYVKSHSHEYFASHFSGNIAKKLADLPTSSQTIAEILCFQFLTAGTGAVIVFVMMWMTQPIFALILLIWLCAHFGLTFLFMVYGNHLWEKHSSSVSTLSGKIVDVFTNILNVRLFARAGYESEYLKKYQEEEIVKAKKAMWLVEILRIGLGISGLFLILGMVFALLYGWQHGWVTLGDFTQVGMQSFWLLGWIWFVSFQITVFAREMGTISDSLALVKKAHDLVDKPNAKEIIIKQGEIVFDDVVFAYQKNRYVFNKLNVTIPAGKKIGLVGFSGSGKSTFVHLILRFYDLNSGQILIDNQSTLDVTQESLRAQIAMIPQDPMLFHRSLIENIRYGRLDATDEEVIHAAKLAHCHEFIEKLDEGYQSLVGERGIKLSGGQRQRIAIARAILKDAPILILDEATSSLDSITEKLIQESLHSLMKGRTTLVVAHRLSTLADMDKIMVFSEGQVIEQGTQRELLQLGGHFALLWNKQTDGFLPDGGESKEC
jgi:ATP-binding cassette subfamily B protein